MQVAVDATRSLKELLVLVEPRRKYRYLSALRIEAGVKESEPNQ